MNEGLTATDWTCCWSSAKKFAKQGKPTDAQLGACDPDRRDLHLKEQG